MLCPTAGLPPGPVILTCHVPLEAQGLGPVVVSRGAPREQADGLVEPFQGGAHISRFSSRNPLQLQVPDLLQQLGRKGLLCVKGSIPRPVLHRRAQRAGASTSCGHLALGPCIPAPCLVQSRHQPQDLRSIPRYPSQAPESGPREADRTLSHPWVVAQEEGQGLLPAAQPPPLPMGSNQQEPEAASASPSSWMSSSSSSPGMSPNGVLGLKMVCRMALSFAVAMVLCAQCPQQSPSRSGGQLLAG